MFSEEEKASIVEEGVIQGKTIATLADGTPCTIESVSLNMQVIEKLNESQYACKVLGVLETDPDDP